MLPYIHREPTHCPVLHPSLSFSKQLSRGTVILTSILTEDNPIPAIMYSMIDVYIRGERENYFQSQVSVVQIEQSILLQKDIDEIRCSIPDI